MYRFFYVSTILSYFWQAQTEESLIFFHGSHRPVVGTGKKKKFIPLKFLMKYLIRKKGVDPWEGMKR